MKKIIFISLLLIITSAAFSQQNNPSPVLTKQDYLQKSKHQKTAAWILAGVGFFSTVLSTVKIQPYGEEETSIHGSGIFLGVGLASIGGSVTLFIAAARNKKKAMSISFKNEPFPQLQQSSFVYRSAPSLALKFQL